MSTDAIGGFPRRQPIVYVSWASHCSRSDSTAALLNGQSYMVYDERWGSRYSTVVFKYVSQFLSTLKLLFAKKPTAVFVMTPPVIACIPVYLYVLLTGTRFVIDAHTGAFVDPRWKPFLFLHRFFSRRAAATIVTNEHLAALVRSWGAHPVVVTDVPIQFAEPVRFPLADGCNMTFVSSFTPDEPLEQFLHAAKSIPDVTFHVTGNPERASPAIHALRPDNVHFTGFLSAGEYTDLITNSDAVIALTKEDFTMQRGAYEAIYLGRPVIVTGFQVLRDSFFKGAVYTDNSIESIIEAVNEMRSRQSTLEAEASQLREHKHEVWNDRERELLSIAIG